jgi:hypothetical protein
VTDLAPTTTREITLHVLVPGSMLALGGVQVRGVLFAESPRPDHWTWPIPNWSYATSLYRGPEKVRATIPISPPHPRTRERGLYWDYPRGQSGNEITAKGLHVYPATVVGGRGESLDLHVRGNGSIERFMISESKTAKAGHYTATAHPMLGKAVHFLEFAGGVRAYQAVVIGGVDGKLDLRVTRSPGDNRTVCGVAKFDPDDPVSGTHAEELPESLLRGVF